MKQRIIHKATIATLLTALSLSACGIKGDLKTPPPLWGDKTKAETPNPDNTSTENSP